MGSACASGDATDSAEGAAGAGPAATFTEVKERVLSTGCVFAECHAAKLPQAGLDLETDPYAALVNVLSPSSKQKYVTPGKTSESYLYEKIAQDRPAAGTRMPPTSPLSAERIELVRSWIAAGAMDD